MGTWHTVLDEQLDLLHFWKSDVGGEVAATFGESMQQVEQEYGRPPMVDSLAANLQFKMIETLARADPFYVDEDMMTLVEAAAESFQPEAFQPTDLITTSAFVVLPRKLTMLDRHREEVAFRGIAWAPQVFQYADGSGSENGVILSLFTHTLLDDDPFMLAEDEHYGSKEWRNKWVSRTGTPWSLMHVTPWVFGDSPGTLETLEGRTDFWRPVQAFMRLSLQTISERDQHRPPRGAAKRWKRYDLPERLITVVRLRRPRQAHSAHEGGIVEWSHQWIVNGHWRNQFYPSLGLHRQIWISPFVKGPEGAPLLVKHGRAFEFVK